MPHGSAIHSDVISDVSKPHRPRRIEVLNGVERRRRWPDEVRLAIIAEALEPGAVVSHVARRHDLSPSQLFGWLKKLRAEMAASADAVQRETATPMFAPAGDGTHFKRGRELAAWLGLVPREHSTGGKQRLLGISKRGSSYLRKLIIHGARSCYLNMNREPHRMGRWIEQLTQRGAHRNVVVVALANKLSRVCWAVMRDGSVYHCVKA